MPRILLIEDDYLYSDDLKKEIDDYFAAAPVPASIDLVETEREFRERFEEIARSGYNLIVVDVMVKWENREREKRRPDRDVLEGGYYRAGFRCVERLRSDPRTRLAKILVHSNLDERFMTDFQAKHEDENTRFVAKSGTMTQFLAVLRQWIPVEDPEPINRP